MKKTMSMGDFVFGWAMLATIAAMVMATPPFHYQDGNSYATPPTEVPICVNSNSSGDVVIVDVPAGKRARFLAVFANSLTAQTVNLFSDDAVTDTAVFAPIYCGDTGGAAPPFVKSGWGETDLGEDLIMNNASAVATSVCVVYTLLPE